MDGNLDADHSHRDTPLPGQGRCRCGRLTVPAWDYCPACGRSLTAETEAADA